jgi:phage tail-like protein
VVLAGLDRGGAPECHDSAQMRKAELGWAGCAVRDFATTQKGRHRAYQAVRQDQAAGRHIAAHRGLASTKTLWAWHRSVTEGNPNAAVDAKLVVTNAARAMTTTYRLVKAWPSKLDISSVTAGASQVALLTLTLVCDQIVVQ